MPPEAALAPSEAPSAPQKPAAAASTTLPAQRNAKQRKRDFRRDRRRRRRITERLASDPTLTDCTKVVALAALAYSDDSAKPVYPAMEAIAEAASCHRRSARRCMVDLVEAGYIRRIQRPIAARRNATNLYYFCEPLGRPAPHREGQRRVPRNRIGRIPTGADSPDITTASGAQNPSSHRRTPESPEPAKQVPNRPETEPSDSTHSASTSENANTRPATPESSSPTPLQAPEPTPQPNRELAHTHLQAAREALRHPNDPRNRPHRTLTT